MNCLIDQLIKSTYFNMLLEISTTILAFFLGLISTFYITRQADKKKRKRLKEFYLSWITYSLESMDRQLILLNDHISELSKTEHSKLKFNNNQIEKLNDISNEELFDAFVISNRGESKLNSENLHKLGNHVEYLVVSLSSIKEKFYDFRNENKDWNKDWNDAFLEFGKVIMDYVSTHQKFMGRNVHELLDLKDHLNNLGKNGVVPSHQIINEFVTPVRKVFAHHLNLNSDPIAMNGVQLSEKLNSLRLRKNHFYTSYIENLKEYNSQIQYTLDKAREIVLFFKIQK